MKATTAMSVHLVWLRNDLRITDNKALYAACHNSDAKVIAVFIATPEQWRQHGISARQSHFIYASLLQVQKSLSQKGIVFQYHQCSNFDDSIEWLDSYCLQQRVTKLFYNRQYEINEVRRDKLLEKRLQHRVICKSFDDSVLLPPGSILNHALQMYKVYTPFRKALIQNLVQADLRSLPVPAIRLTGPVTPSNIPRFFDYPFQAIDPMFPIGEQNALHILRKFCKEKVYYYVEQRDIPAIQGTSQLSPYLSIGVLSPRQCWNRLKEEFVDLLIKPKSGAFSWLNELIWREFYRHLMAFYPSVCMGKPFIPWTEKIEWNKDSHLLQAWKQGYTGFPIIDAAMRQLNTIGWMHNRLRMITASFLVKDLLVDWRIGEEYFMSQLLDGDLASNNGGWQWAASTGNDSVPYFRIFNPTIQGKRFDPQGTFIRHWLPELNNVPTQYIHAPHSWLDKNDLSLNYPLPIVDHKKACHHTLNQYYAAKKQSLL
ncbi:deoxyribodipyrimidine photo-lyase [Candidatus Liberibacter asiaticus]|uniref:Deoxyribodipyrimidine photo-lyase n=3 Tax=Liberibacter asiaticus TaxID=34021 RepID=C6XGZ0_LIBAP|nr:deoxyribodipyrimidine photo-lyase [Candidatus Liberibacter asiaticus]ACT57643.1 deoxyribodipyrimidine photolyase [Candidatus Liberibacter asiaticus str. psy62]AGH17403.1 deoxyribodipyrimidine photolyase [Candidatus Liberibacter asiaticus str. gxpsy]ALK07677.1 deoxyribodipyrimidine photo-lyase [Candidatus Liberibacter asiaticus]ASK53172.1 deoxyribodipyrimidine photo-lyase [Candidatus Liberibacter asiaticus]AWL14490.1 deoxyribodipyrimidine photo-lyase [Candidatus Liberibacter asiaticus]